MADERHFRARTPRALKEEAPPPVDIIITSTFSALSARPRTDRGREFLRERYWHPLDYVDQAIEIQPGRYWETFRVALREAGLRAQYDGSGNHREVE